MFSFLGRLIDGSVANSLFRPSTALLPDWMDLILWMEGLNVLISLDRWTGWFEFLGQTRYKFFKENGLK